MDHEPDRDPSEAEAVRLYLDAIEVPPVPWAGIEARARRLRERRGWRGYTTPLVGVAVAAALLLAIGGRVLAPVLTPGVHAGPAAITLQRGRINLPRSGPAASSGSATTTFAAADLPVAPVSYGGRTYRVLAAPVPPSAIGRLLAGRAPNASTWQVPGKLPAHPGPFHVLALFVVNGQPATSEIAVLGRFGSGPPALWEAKRASVSPVPKA
jgi:hypothetical protein